MGKKNGLSASSAYNYNDQEQLAKRAKRFEREAEIERARQAAKQYFPVNQGNSFQSWSKQNKYRNMGADDQSDPVYDPVSVSLFNSYILTTSMARMLLIGIGIPSLEDPLKCSSITFA